MTRSKTKTTSGILGGVGFFPRRLATLHLALRLHSILSSSVTTMITRPLNSDKVHQRFVVTDCYFEGRRVWEQSAKYGLPSFDLRRQ